MCQKFASRYADQSESLGMFCPCRSTVILGFANVPVDQVDRIEEKFNEVIHGILNHPNHEDLMSRMGVISK